MKKILIAVVLSGLTGGLYAAGWSEATQFSDQLNYLAVKAEGLKALSSMDDISVPAVPKAVEAESFNGDKSMLRPDLDIPAFDGKVIAAEGVALAQQDLSLKVKWYCVKSDYFSTTGWKGCGQEYNGERSVKIDGTGSFSFPKIDVGGPLFSGVFVVGITLNQNGEELQVIGDYCDHGYFANPVPVSKIKSDLKNLNIVLVKGGKYPANIIAKETGLPDIGFEEISQRYPGSDCKNVSAELTFIYDKVAGQPRTNPWHPTFSKIIRGTYERGSLSFPDRFWAIRGFKNGTPVQATLKFSAEIHIVKNGNSQYKSVNTEKETTVDGAQEIKLPAAITESFDKVVLSID